jgi:hypothetical protein
VQSHCQSCVLACYMLCCLRVNRQAKSTTRGNNNNATNSSATASAAAATAARGRGVRTVVMLVLGRGMPEGNTVYVLVKVSLI